jgi:hypothetical protein
VSETKTTGGKHIKEKEKEGILKDYSNIAHMV